MISNSNFILKDIPNYNPWVQRLEYDEFWREQKRRCIEGYWSGGKWMPPELYYYVNFHTIEVMSGITKMLSRPFLRDIDWEKAYIWTEATGFSGFADDTVYTCDRKYGPEKETAIKYKRITKEEADSKIYIPTRDYLKRTFITSMGKPLYRNEGKNIIDLESRGGGKTYWATGCCAHNFLFDGARDYDEYLALKKTRDRMTSQGVVGAIVSTYVDDFTSKVLLSIKNLPGSYTMSYGKNSRYEPPPLQISWTGSTEVGGKGITNSSGSKIYPYSFANNPLAANGKRPNRAWLDEVGFFTNIMETKKAIETSQVSESFKRLTIHMMGTGGYTAGGAAMHAYDLFYNPENHNCLSFDDLYEGKGKIGYFVPATKALNEFKFGPDYITDEKLALECILEEREKEKKAGKKSEIAAIINKPIYPSEIFLQKEGGVFPLEDIKAQIAFVEQSLVKYDTSLKYELTYRDGRLTPIVSMKFPIREFPLGTQANMDACIEIWELPKRDDLGNVYSNRYIAGWDVVDADGNEDNKLSLQSLFIMDAISGEIVAEYTARTYLADQFYEQARRLLILYNAIVNYEQNKKGPYTHFKNKNSLYLMCKTPEILRATGLSKTKNSTGNNMLGTHSNAETNALGIELIQKWLEEPAYHNNPEGTLRNIDTIKSLGLLRELFMWNKDINADRVSALIMLLILKTDRTRITESISQNNVKDKGSDSFWDKAWKGKLRR